MSLGHQINPGISIVGCIDSCIRVSKLTIMRSARRDIDHCVKSDIPDSVLYSSTYVKRRNFTASRSIAEVSI